MARRFNKRESETAEPPDSGAGSMAGMIKFQPTRRTVDRSQNQPQSKEFGLKEDFSTNDLKSMLTGLSISQPTSRNSQSGSTRPMSSPFDLPQDPKTSVSDMRLPMAKSRVHPSPTDRSSDGDEPSIDTKSSSGFTGWGDDLPTQPETVDSVFGKLPDPVRLQEQMGDFDGQVVFIGHPNRNVSAHQWSLPSFQWENIGRWNNNNRKIEGSLASDRLTAVGKWSNSLSYFKKAAQGREKRIVDKGRPKPEEEPIAQQRPTLTDLDRMASLSTVSSAGQDTSLTRPIRNDISSVPVRYPRRKLSASNVTPEELEDPFVTPVGTDSSQRMDPTCLKFNTSTFGLKGSMDFGYEFPTQSTSNSCMNLHQNSDLNSHKLFVQKERERIEELRRGALARDPTRLSHFNLPEVEFGEEAASAFPTPVKSRDPPPRASVPISPEELQNRQKLKEKLSQLGNQAHRGSVSSTEHVVIPHVPALQPSLRTLLPPPGLTVANPRRTSTLNAKAAPYVCKFNTTTSHEDAQSEAPTVYAAPPANLRFSDPEEVQRMQYYDIVNGFSQQMPTRQNFKGPFFNDSKPTANDPTASLSVQVSVEEELTNWFRDGQRPARQEQYSNSLMSAAIAGHKTQNFSTIGEDSSKEKDEEKYENTPAFVRLYENLFEYMEEYKQGSGKTYWTRAWKKAPSHLCDLSPEGNNSFFETPPTTSVRAPPQLPRAQPQRVAGHVSSRTGEYEHTISRKPAGASSSSYSARVNAERFNGMRLGAF